MGAHSSDSVATDKLMLNMTIHEDHFAPAPVGSPKSFALDVLDRAARTALQTAAGYLLVGEGLNIPTTAQTWLALGGIVAASVILSVATAIASAPSFGNSYWFQLVERAVKTFCQSLVAGFGVTVATGEFLTLPHNFTVLLSGSAVAALTSLLTSVYTTNLGTDKAVGSVNLSV